ncbi:MAG TPA: response regulator [Desulfobacteraceae bacterium]|nr:response regulator [Desulfobacteraceae bacterium]HPJ66598.1 response regulator [Desulfobacteraceae bacterium]HPQ27864.1 response regulator [Desulfobacteraceae bacterium]
MIILIVEDKEENRYLLEALLKGSGHDVESVANGAEALERLKSGGIDLIISDILMPIMDGFELCRRVKTDETLRHIPFIIYTATYTGPQDEEFAIKIGADQFIIKPCEPEVFIKAVQDVMAAAGRNDIPSMPATLREDEVLKLYNERLVRKLEQKMLQLEKEFQAKQKAEETLRDSEKKYRSLYKSIRDAILVSDTNRMIIDCNPAFVDLFGYSLEELAGKKTLIIYDNEKEFRQMANVLKDHVADTSLFFTVSFKKKDGTVFPGEVNVFNLRNDEGATVGFIVLIRDITERRLAEEEREKLQEQFNQAQKLEAIAQLAGGIAHDFNNLLTVILGYGEIILYKLDRDDPVRKDIQEIMNAGSSAANLSRQLLAFSRKQTLQTEVIDLNYLVENLEKMLRRLLPENIEFMIALDENLGRVKADPGQIEQVVMNLAVNARDAMFAGGRLIVETANVELDKGYAEKHLGAMPGRYVMLAISDTGCGMDEATRSRVFEPFFTTKGIGKGTGLGLSTVYGIVKQSGGDIRVYSEPGKGTAFKIYLPCTDDEPISRAERAREEELQVNGKHVLVVDDEPSLRNLVERMLVTLGFRVTVAANGGEALSAVEEKGLRPEFVITDVVMPGISCMELVDRLHKTLPELKVIFMSGYRDNNILQQYILDSGIPFIQKPFKRKDLVSKIKKLLRKVPAEVT